MLANPPWDKVDFEDKKYFPKIEPSIAEISGLARRDRIAEWMAENLDAGAKYRTERRKVKSSFLFYGSSWAFPLTGKGLSIKGVTSLNLNHLFAERFTAIAAPTGRVGCIIPTSLATGAGAQYLFGDLTQRGAITHLYDFENRKRSSKASTRVINSVSSPSSVANFGNPRPRSRSFFSTMPTSITRTESSRSVQRKSR